MPFIDIIRNPVLISCLVASFLAQILKLPIEYFRTKKWDWSLMLSTGGMPSSHSAMVTAAAAGVGTTWASIPPLLAWLFPWPPW